MVGYLRSWYSLQLLLSARPHAASATHCVCEDLCSTVVRAPYAIPVYERLAGTLYLGIAGKPAQDMQSLYTYTHIFLLTLEF